MGNSNQKPSVSSETMKPPDPPTAAKLGTKEQSKLEAAFKSMDSNGNNTLSCSELINRFKEIAVDIDFAEAATLTSGQIVMLFKSLDLDGGDSLDISEFTMFIAECRKLVKSRPSDTTKGDNPIHHAIFDMVDVERKGQVSVGSLKRGFPAVTSKLGMKAVLFTGKITRV